VKNFEISLDRKKLLISKDKTFYIVESDVKAAAFSDQKVLAKSTINLAGWSFFTNPRADFSRHFFRCVAPGKRLFL